METKELKITIPENHEIDWQESAKQEKIVFKKIDIKPRSWEEYCKQTPANTHWGFYKGQVVDIFCGTSCELLNKKDKASVPSKELAEAFLAMMQLMSLRQDWIGDWEPDWNNEYLNKYCIIGKRCCFEVYMFNTCRHPLSFPTEEMAEDFMNTFKDLLNVAKPLI